MPAVGLAALLDLEVLDRDLFRGENEVGAGARMSLYGGQVAAQALRAAVAGWRAVLVRRYAQPVELDVPVGGHAGGRSHLRRGRLHVVVVLVRARGLAPGRKLEPAGLARG